MQCTLFPKTACKTPGSHSKFCVDIHRIMHYTVDNQKARDVMEKKTILFDLDGTLTDSGEGIFYCAEKVLAHYHLPIPSRQEMRCMVGPPLATSFPWFGIRQEDVHAAIALYRKHYNESGIFMNVPYPGIRALLETLKSHGHTLCVATSKPENMAHIVLEHFELSQYFDWICGASADGVRHTKSQVIAYLLEQTDRNGEMVMVGDTVYDVQGAKEFGIPTIGVAWGYGVAEDMLSEGAIAIAKNTDHLLFLLEADK